MPIRNRYHHRLHRSKPDRESAAVVLDQDPEETLHATQQGTVNHVRAMRSSVFANVLKLEALRHVEVELDGAELPLTTERVVDLQINLRPVERTTTFVHFVRDIVSLDRLSQGFGGHIPVLWLSHVLLWACGKVGGEIGQAESAQNGE